MKLKLTPASGEMGFIYESIGELFGEPKALFTTKRM